MEKEQPQGFLFDSIAFYSEESVENMINNLDKKTVYYVLTQALAYAHTKNVFSLTESEIISKSLRILNKEIYSYDDTTGENTSNIENN
jgi:hypothetical protein